MLKGKLPKLPTGAAQISAGTETEHGEGLCPACHHLTSDWGLHAEGSTEGRQFLLVLHCPFPGKQGHSQLHNVRHRWVCLIPKRGGGQKGTL